MDISPSTVETLLSVDENLWRKEIFNVHEYFKSFGVHTPNFIWDHVTSMEHRLDIGHNTPATTNTKLLQWVNHWKSVFDPAAVHWVDGTEEGMLEERQGRKKRMGAEGEGTDVEGEGQKKREEGGGRREEGRREEGGRRRKEERGE
jgi:GTP-dependent phosphoenolpyruvate carboxykinase